MSTPAIDPAALRMARVRQRFARPRVDDVAGAVGDALGRLPLSDVVRPGETVAIGVGSRGIANLAAIVRALVDAVRAVGAEPFVVPAMGSHGGNTEEGRRAVLTTYGVTEATVGAPVRASGDSTLLGTSGGGVPIHFDRAAAEAGRVVLVNRVKPHTTFSGTIESGLAKMLCIGLGNAPGAAAHHRAAVRTAWDDLIHDTTRAVLARVRFGFGLALVENAYDETAHVEAVSGATLLAREPELLQLARRLMPRLPVDPVDLLIVDEMGKHISGSGMDTNITGRKRSAGRGQPSVRRVFVRELGPASHGNALGIGFADFTTTRLLRAMDDHVTQLNAIIAAHPEAAALPLRFDTDRAAIAAALATAGVSSGTTARVVRIRSTLQVAEADVSEACLGALRARDDVEIAGAARPLAFDAHDDLAPFDA